MNGLLLFNKPIGWTSHDAVAFVRSRLGAHAGHAGTLDPMATGLLLILLGDYTRRSGELAGLDKDYRGLLELGFSTDTQDLEGKIISSAPFEQVTAEMFEAAFREVAARTEQTPPAFSAVKKNGRSLYRSARAGVMVTADPRPASVLEARIEKWAPPEAEFFLKVAKGFYVRTFCHDIGQVLGCGAVLTCLVRTRIGPYPLANACGPADFDLGVKGVKDQLARRGAWVQP